MRSHLPPPTAASEQESGQPVLHKYKHPLFDGLQGERHLLSLAQKFAPFALWRTWYAQVSYQAPGEECYVGVTRLIDERPNDHSIHVGVKERKIYLDLAALEARGWVRQERVRKPFKTKDGNVVYRVVPVKDYTGFYDTAYDYHKWLEDANYIAPDRDNVPLILADPELTKRLIRFENYRRLLVCAKPGRKPQQDRQDFYQCQLAHIAQQGTNVQDVNQYSNLHTNEDSPYRISDNGKSTTNYRDSDSSTSEREEDVAAKTIRNLHKKVTSNGLKTNPNLLPQENTLRGEDAKEVKGSLGYNEAELKQDTGKRGAAFAGIPSDQYAKLNGGLDREEQEEARRRAQESLTQSRPVRELPVAVTRAITEFATLYDDKNLIRSDVTRAAKIYFTAAQAIEHFNETLFFALFDQARHAALKKTNCTHANKRGHINRIPFFFTCLENAFSFSLEELVYLRSDDPLYMEYTLWDVTDKVHDEYQRLFNTGQITEDYRSWLCIILDELEKRKEPKQRLNQTTRT